MAKEFGELEGRLLIAHAILRDPNFRRTVVYLCDYDAEDGAFGLILNRPLGQTAADFLPDDADAIEVLAKVPVFQGGPVGSDRLVFAELGWDKKKKSAHVRHAIGMSEVVSLVEEGSTSLLRAFIGYAGWSAGQLEEEIAQGSWVIADPVAATFQLDRLAKLWSDTLSRLGPAYRLMAMQPDNPSLN
jgi:putative transcriptional regulator